LLLAKELPTHITTRKKSLSLSKKKQNPFDHQVKPLNFPFCRFFTEEECIGTCKDAKRTNKKKVVCPHAAPICQLGCVLGKEEEDNDEGTCLTCICNKKPALEKQDVSICLEPARTGLCKAALKYWYYNADRQACEEFTYGGCEAGSSPNKFHTKVLCQEACQGVKKE